MVELSFRCLLIVCVLCFFPTLPWVGLQCVIGVFSDHTHLPFDVTTIVFVLCGYHKTFPHARN